jgi:hypothetical protein
MYNNREKGKTNMNEMYFKIPVMRRDFSLISKESMLSSTETELGKLSRVNKPSSLLESTNQLSLVLLCSSSNILSEPPSSTWFALAKDIFVNLLKY